MLKKLLVLLALGASFNPALAESPQVEIKIGAAGYSEADARLALETFRRNCRPLGDDFWSDVENVTIEIKEESAPYRIAMGWKTSLHLALTYSQNPQFGPRFASGPGLLAGHTLHYYVGGGSNPGFLSGKKSAQYLCGQAFHPNGDDTFVAVPEFSALDR